MVEALGDGEQVKREQLPPYWALFARGQLRWTTVGILSGVCAGTAYFLISVLLPKALVDQGAAVSLSFGLTSLVYFASIPGKAFTGFLMEIIGRRWTIFYALAGSLPGLFLMLMAHRAGQFATVVMVTGALITGFTVLSAFTAIPRLSVRAIPDRSARTRAALRRIDRPVVRRRAGAVSDGTVYSLAGDLFRHDPRRGVRSAPLSRCCLARRPSANSKP